MREIKFRAWIVKDYKEDGNTPNEWEMLYDAQDTHDSKPHYDGGFGNILIDGDSAVMQYTGLKDKNGKEIYEGDILNDNIIICWRQDLASFALRKEGWLYDHYFGEAVDAGQTEVIGNIYETPNLINK